MNKDYLEIRFTLTRSEYEVFSKIKKKDELLMMNNQAYAKIILLRYCEAKNER